MTDEKKQYDFGSLLLVMNRRRAGGEANETRESVRRLLDAGLGGVVTVDGISCLPLARNTALSMALKQHHSHRHLTHLLLLDDDVAFELDHVQKVIDASTLQTPAACLYMTEDNRWAGAPCTKDTWLVGLGFVCFRFDTLEALSRRSEKFATDQHPDGVWEFTMARTVLGGWHSDDYYLTRRLGGCRVVGVVGHVKPVALMPTPEDAAKALQKQPGPYYSHPLSSNDPILEVLNSTE